MKLKVLAALILLLCLFCAAAQAEFTLPASTQVIEAEAFSGSRSIQHLWLPDNLQRIETKAFYNCGISTVYLPSSLEYIAEDAFNGNSGMKAVAEPGTYAYNWASRKGFIKNEAVAFLMSHDITVASNAYADLSYAFLAPQAYTYYGIDIDGELSSYSEWNGTYDRNFPIIFGASASVGDHTIQAFVADENWNKTYLDSAVLHVVQGPTVNLSLNISDDSIVIYDQESVSFTYSASCQNANVRSLYAFFFDNQSGYHELLNEFYGLGSTESQVSGTITLNANDFPEDGEYQIVFSADATNGLTESKTITVVKETPVSYNASAYAWLTDCYVLSWDGVPNATGYYVYYSIDPDMSENYLYKYYEDDGSEGYTVNINTIPGNQYYFEIFAMGPNYYIATGLTDECIAPLPAPANFRSTGIGEDGTVNLSWDQVHGTGNYRVSVSHVDAFTTEMYDYTFFDQSPCNLNLFDWGFVPGETAYLWISAQTDEGPGVPSACLTVELPELTPALSLTSDPISQTVEHGDSVTLSVTASGGAGSYSYQWYRANSETAAGVKMSASRNYTFTADSRYQGYYYYCVVTSGTETVTSARANLTFTTSTVTSISIFDNSGEDWYVGDGIYGDLESFVSVVPSSISPYALNYYSTNPAVATVAVNANGTIAVSMTGLGEADIVAEATNGTQARLHVKVVDPNSVLTITANPVSQTAEHGDSVTFSVTASGGTGNYTYKWYRAKGETDTGTKVGTSRNCTVTADSYYHGRYYYCVVTSGTESVTSARARLTFTTSTVTSIEILEYEGGNWYVGDSFIDDLDDFAAVTPANISPNALNYYSTNTDVVSVSFPSSGKIDIAMEGVGEADVVAEATNGIRRTWHVKVLNTLDDLSIATSPVSQTVQEGDSVTFRVSAAGGAGSYTYQWYCASNQTETGTKVSTSRNYTFTASTAYDGYYYYCIVSSGSLKATSERAMLTVNKTSAAALSITTHPSAATVYEGDSVTMGVSVTGGTGSYTYQWYKASSQTATGSEVSTFLNYTFTAASSDNGYYYYCVVTSGSESVTSSRAKLTVLPLPVALTITAQPSSKTVNEGASVTMSVTAAGGTGSYTYQWYRASSQNTIGTRVSTSRNYSFTANSIYDGYYYYCDVTSGSETATSDPVKLTVISQTVSEISGKLTKTSYTVAQNGTIDLQGYVQATNCTIGVISVSVYGGANQALTKSYSSQGPTSIDLSDIFTIDPSGNSNFRNAGTYSITVYAKAYGSNDAVEIGSATVTVTSVQRPSLSVTINDKTYTAVKNSDTGIVAAPGSTSPLWVSVAFSQGLTRLEVALFDGGGYEKPVIKYQDYQNGVRTGKTGNFVITGNVDTEANNPFTPGFYFPEGMTEGTYWMTAIGENDAGRTEVKVQINIGKGISAKVDALPYHKGMYFNEKVDGCVQCWGYAYYVQDQIYGSHSKTNMSGSSVTKGNMTAQKVKDLVTMAGIGAHVRLRDSNGNIDAWKGHSFIITEITDTGFSIAQCHGYLGCLISNESFTWESALAPGDECWANGTAWIRKAPK